MIPEFPPDHELIAFFEAEPAVLDPDAPWQYNTLEFQTFRNGIVVQCKFVPSYGKLTTRLVLEGQELAKYELRNAAAFHLTLTAKQEILVVTFPPNLRLDNFALQLKPKVWAAWGNLHQIP